MLLDCRCGTKNRIPSLPTTRVRCGKCKHEFTPSELVKAVHEPPPPKPTLEDLFGGIGDILGGLNSGFDLPDE